MSASNIKPPKKSGLVCIFAKTPKPGKVKTRLEPDLGVDACLRLHKWLVEDRLKIFAKANLESASSKYEAALYVTDDLEDEYWVDLNANSSYSIPLYLQQGDTLGDRMWHAAEDALEQRDWVILIGADCPDMDLNYIQTAISAMEAGQEAVIGPATDGGYVLLGLTQAAREVFQGIDWGTNKVLRQTIAAFEELGFCYSQLAPRKDLDIFDDYLYYRSRIKI